LISFGKKDTREVYVYFGEEPGVGTSGIATLFAPNKNPGTRSFSIVHLLWSRIVNMDKNEDQPDRVGFEVQSRSEFFADLAIIIGVF
jgi:hypothetical protein